MNFLLYIFAAAIGIFLPYVGTVFALLSGREFATLVGGLLVAAHVGTVVFVFNRARQGRGPQVAFVLAMPLPLVMVAMCLYLIGHEVLILFEREPPEFSTACQTAGAKYYKLPDAPVHSVAYDWNSESAPTYTAFSLNFADRVSGLGMSDVLSPRCPDQLTFVERRHSSRREGLPPGSPGPYVRFPCHGRFYGVTDLTADVLVKYQINPEEELREAPVNQRMVVYDLTVTDRRNDELLASFRYVIDAKNRRACGLTEDNKMNERTFVLKAIGLQ